MPEVWVNVNGRRVEVTEGATVAAALFVADQFCFRTSVSGMPRGPLCGIGTCFECRVSIDGSPHQRSCRIPVRNGMNILTT